MDGLGGLHSYLLWREEGEQIVGTVVSVMKIETRDEKRVVVAENFVMSS